MRRIIALSSRAGKSFDEVGVEDAQSGEDGGHGGVCVLDISHDAPLRGTSQLPCAVQSQLHCDRQSLGEGMSGPSWLPSDTARTPEQGGGTMQGMCYTLTTQLHCPDRGTRDEGTVGGGGARHLDWVRVEVGLNCSG